MGVDWDLSPAPGPFNRGSPGIFKSRATYLAPLGAELNKGGGLVAAKPTPARSITVQHWVDERKKNMGLIIGLGLLCNPF